jgi:RNA polymerase sigma-70 factor (ECF subfamily)
MTNETSLSLLARVSTQPQAADWERFTSLYEPLIRGWLRKREVLNHDADDLAQEILTVVVRKVNNFEHNGRTGAFRTWLRTITVNCLRDHWRSRKSKPAGAGGSDMQELISQLADPASALSRLWDQEHDRYVMQRLLELLESQFEPQTWLAFQRFALENIPAAEVAAELGITSNAVFIAKSRVMARLRQESAGLLDEN